MSIIYRVDMTNRTVKKEQLDKEYNYLGGRSLIDRILLNEVDPMCHPLGPNNKLIIASGLLSGTIAPSSGRVSVGGKSPLTNGIKESNAGGPTGQNLGKLGIRAIIIEGMPQGTDDEFFILTVKPNSVKIISAPSELVGKGCYHTVKYCKEKYGESRVASVMAIGPAGEMRSATACISLSNMEGDASRQAGRGGMGALMGAKKIKAIVIDPCSVNTVTYQDYDSFDVAAKKLSRTLIDNTGILRNYGTGSLMVPIGIHGALPVKNFSEGVWDKSDKISGYKINELMESRGGRTGHSCHPGCCIGCSNVIVDKDGKYVTGSLEFETLALLGSNCLIDDLDKLAELDFKCDDYGIDTMDFGVVAGIAMEAGMVAWGDADGLLNLLDEIGSKTTMGRLVAAGAATFGRVFGQWRVSQCKGQATAAYDPRGNKGTGVTYVTSTQGADHTAGNGIPGRGGVDCKDPEVQASFSRNLQVYSSYMIDSTGLCLFVGCSHTKADIIAELLNAKYGAGFSKQKLYTLGVETLLDELKFNRLAGVPDLDIPEFLRIESLSPHNHTFDVSLEDLKRVYDFDYVFAEDKTGLF